MTQKGFDVLNSIVQQYGSEIIDKVISSTDPNIIKDYHEEIMQLCILKNIKFFNRKQIFKVDTSFALAISWKWMISLNETKLITLHDSLLPAFRGFAPLVNALIKGETEIGVSAIFSSDDFDRGNIIIQKSLEINYPVKIQSIIDQISLVYIEVALELVKMILNEMEINGQKQDETLANYSLWLDKDDYIINWKQSSSRIKRFIDAVGSPYLGARTFDGEKTCLIHDAELESDVFIQNRHHGKVIFIKDNQPIVVCGQGLLRITEMTDESGNDLLPIKKFRTRFS